MFRAGSSPIGPGRGMAVGKRGGGAWSPGDEAGKLLWVRGDIAATTASRVTSWTDRSGNASHPAALAGSTTQPLLTTWAAGNSAPALYFDGNDRLATAANILPTASGAAFSTFLVCDFDDTAARCPIRTNETSGGIALSQNVASTLKVEHWKTGVTFDEDGAARTTPLNIVALNKVTTIEPSAIYVNGAPMVTSQPNAQIVTPSGKLYVGAAVSGQFHKGYIAEILILTGTASPAMIARWNAYSLARYGV